MDQIEFTSLIRLKKAKVEKANSIIFLEVITNVDLGNKKLIGLEDAVTNTKVFISPIICLIEVEEVADE